MLLSVYFLTWAFVHPSIRFTCFQVQLFLHDQYYYFMTLEVTEFQIGNENGMPSTTE